MVTVVANQSLLFPVAPGEVSTTLVMNKSMTMTTTSPSLEPASSIHTSSSDYPEDTGETVSMSILIWSSPGVANLRPYAHMRP